MIVEKKQLKHGIHVSINLHSVILVQQRLVKELILQFNLFDLPFEEFVEELISEVPELIKVSEQHSSLINCYVLTKNFVWYLQLSMDSSVGSKILLQLDRKKIKPRTLYTVFNRTYNTKERLK